MSQTRENFKKSALGQAISDEPVNPENTNSQQKPVPSSAEGPTQVQVLSQQDSLVANLAREQRTIADIEGLNVRDASVLNLLELPEECKPFHGKDYRFRWLAKDKNLEAKLNTGIWLLCTRTNAPFIKPHRFKSSGVVEQAGMILAFTSEKVAKIRESIPAEKSRRLLKHYTEDLPKSKERGFYKPESIGSDEDDDKEPGLIEGRDF